MPYPESCPECGSTFRNTGTHFTARRSEIGRHVLLELGCQNTTRRFWWDFTTGSVTEEGRPTTARRAPLADAVGPSAATNGALRADSIGSFQVETNGHVALSTVDPPQTLGPTPATGEVLELKAVVDQAAPVIEPESRRELDSLVVESVPGVSESPGAAAASEPESEPQSPLAALLGPSPGASTSLKDAFVRQLQLDRLTLRQMRSWLMSEEARRAVEVAAGATEATYERLALILFGSELPHLLGKPSSAPQNTGMSAEDRLELQREKARIRARLRRAAAKAARRGE